MSLLTLSALFLTVGIISILVAHKTGIGSALGYLLFGILVGQSGAELIDTEEILHFSEFGVVIMLFIIGLELKPQSLWNMRHKIIGFGLSQLTITIVVLSIFFYILGDFLFSLSPSEEFSYLGIIFVMCFGLSSTAMVLTMLADQEILHTYVGKSAFSVLLLQDIAAMPMLAFTAFIAVDAATDAPIPAWVALLSFVTIVGALWIISVYLIRPFFQLIARTGSREIFTATSLLIVVSIALLMNLLSLSPAIGAFLAGVVLANSEYRHELETSLEPFKGLLLGLFFIAVGMSMNLNFIAERPFPIFTGIILIVLIKMLVLWFISSFSRMKKSEKLTFSIILAQGSEFSFLISYQALSGEVITLEQKNILDILITSSMTITPFLVYINNKIILPKMQRTENISDDSQLVKHNVISQYDIMHKHHQENKTVIIAGFGRFGQTIGRFLTARGVQTVVLDHDPEHIENLRYYGIEVFYGDISRVEFLKAAGITQASLFIVTIENIETSINVVKKVRKMCPNLKILARVIDLKHAHSMMQLGVELLELETFHSAVQLSRKAIESLGIHPYDSAKFSLIFTQHNYDFLKKSLNVEDKEMMADLYKSWSKELDQVFNNDVNYFKSRELWRKDKDENE